MKEVKTEYMIVNVFSDDNEARRKERINTAIKNLCILEVEKEYDSDYNVGVAFHDSVSDLKKEERCKC